MSKPNERDIEVAKAFLDATHPHPFNMTKWAAEQFAAYREELETRAYLRGCREAEEKARDIAHLTAPAPAQSREEDSLERMLNHVSRLLHYDDGRPADVQMVEAARLIDAELATLRFRQSPQAVAIDDIFRIDAVVEASEESAAKCSWRRIKGAIVAPRPSAEPQPSPQGEDADFAVILVALEHGAKTYLGLRDIGTIGADEIYEQFAESIERLSVIRARLASIDADARWVDPEDGNIYYAMTAKEYAAIYKQWRTESLASAQSSAQSEEAAYNHAEVFHRRLVAAQEAILDFPVVVTELVRGYGIDVNEKQIDTWLRDALNRKAEARAALERSKEEGYGN